MELEKWELDVNELTSRMRLNATDKLEEEKLEGERKKAITNADVEAKMAELYPDEVRHQRLKRARTKGTVEHLERLASLWSQRCSTLGTMLKTLRK